MRKLVAIVCLTTFFALQYGKLVSFWNCKINAVITQAICDCEKLLIDVHKDDGQPNSPVAIAKEKTEERYFPADLLLNCRPFIVNGTTSTSKYLRAAPEGFYPPVFQPPRV